VIPIHDTVPRRGSPFVTWMLIAANSLVFLLELSFHPKALERLFYLFGVVPARYAHPEWAAVVGLAGGGALPFLTSLFLHGGWLHVIGNMWFLWIFGDNVEDRMGHFPFLLFYILSGVAAGLVHVRFNSGSTLPTVGASGAIAGVMAAYVLLFPTARVVTLIPVLFLPLFVEIPALFYVAVWFFLQLVSGTFSIAAPRAAGGIAWWAHVGGFVCGVVLLPLFKKRRRSYRRHYADEHYPFRGRGL
jgi:membrane associated rhomboid family serine protease